MGYTQNCEIWHGPSLGTLIKIQEEPIWRTMWGQCFGHKSAMFWPFLVNGATGYTQQCEILLGTSLSKLIEIEKEPILRTMWGQCFGHKRAMFWPYVGKGARSYTQKCEIWHRTSRAQWSKFRKIQFEGPYEDPVLAIKGPCLAISRKGGYRIHPALWNLAWNIGHTD